MGYNRYSEYLRLYGKYPGLSRKLKLRSTWNISYITSLRFADFIPLQAILQGRFYRNSISVRIFNPLYNTPLFSYVGTIISTKPFVCF